jgi:ABC-2 type transport system permease protein
MRRVLCLIKKELLELRQDPALLRVVLVAPIIQLTILGYAATTDVKNVPVIVADQDRSTESRRLINQFEASPYFTVTGIVGSSSDIDPHLERGDVWMAVVIPGGYGQRVSVGLPTAVQLVADGSDASSTNVALGYASNLVAGYAQELVARSRPGGAVSAGGIDARVRVWFNPQLESRYFMVPGVLALLLIVITAVLSSMAIVREKELGTLEQLSVTPLRRWELVVGKLLPYGLIGMVDVLLVVAVAVFWFEIPLRGSFALLLGLSAIYLLNTLGLGLLVSTISDNQQQAMMTAAFFVVVPMMFLSGFVFLIENMPAVIQPLTYAIPLRYYLVIVRGIFLKGVGIKTLWPQAAALLGWGIGIVVLATLRSHKRAA